MEPAIILLDEHTDQATRQMLQNVVVRKRKFETLKKKHILSIVAAMTLSCMLLVYLYFYIAVPYSYSFFAMFSVFVNNSMHFLFLLITVGVYSYMILLKKQRDKAEKEFHGLRCEIIDRSKDLWKQKEEWKNRHKVFEMMKKNYDINLYHENK
ncbi:YpbF family protein [Peribacillus sp. SCS-155]|uniref:YpbF family protein n=1 Tax=Peribacillus sedimenti TaxID=3115297 RepID=UPI00390592EB